MLTGVIGYWLNIFKKEFIIIKRNFVDLVMEYLHNFQCNN